MAERFLTAAREASIEPALNFLGARVVARLVRLEQRNGSRHRKNIYEAAGRTEHQAREQRAKRIVDVRAAIHLVVQSLEMLQISQHLLERHDAGNRRELARELRRNVELAEGRIVVDDD